MSKTITTPLDQKRVSQIAQSIRGAVSPFTAANQAKVDADNDAKAMRNAEVNSRETIMVALADLSQTGQWTEGEISAAAARAAQIKLTGAAGANDSSAEKVLATFIGETKRAMHPRVRSHVSTLIALRDLAWENETQQIEADKDAPRPFRKAFARKYHLLTAMFLATSEGRVFADHSELVDWAEEHNPDLDLDKVAKRLERIKAQLQEFHNDWPVDDIQVCIDALSEVDKKALKHSRAGNVVNMPTKKAEPSAPTTTVVGDSDAAQSGGSEIVEGAVDMGDILDEVLGEDRAELVAA